MANLFSDMNEWYQNNIGQPFVRSPIGQAVSGFFGVDATDPTNPSDIYKNAQALGNLPGMNIPAGAGKGLIQFLAHSPEIATAIMAGGKALKAPKAELELAKQMYNAGESYRDIHAATKVHAVPGVPPQWEISDEPMKLLIPNGAYQNMTRPMQGKLGQFLEHKELYDNYPDLGNIDVIFKKGPVNASYNHSGNTITVSANNVDEARSALVHELDHAVAAREGFPSGGDPNLMLTGQKAENLYNNLKQLEARLQRDLTQGRALTDPAYKTSLQDGLSRTQARMKLYDTLKNYPDDAAGRQRAYEDLYGEISARNAQTRLDFTEAERYAKPPADTMDIPRYFPLLSDGFGGAYYDSYSHPEALMSPKPPKKFDPFGDTTE